MKLEHLPDDILIDYKVDKNNKKKYIHRDKKIKESFALQDLLTDEQIEILRGM